MKPLPQMQLTHMGMFVRDIDRMAAFYKEVLGFVETDRGEVRGHTAVFLTRDPTSHHQLVLESGRPEDSGATHAIQQISFKVGALDDLRMMYRVVWDRTDITDLKGVDHGIAWSLYFRDPEGNRIEIYLDTPWHIAQPHGHDLDLSLSDEEIHRRTEARIASDPTLIPVAEWQRAHAGKLRETGVRIGE
ncbi:MAG: VOC family protein [Betaproteobacteria bacterium]|nr:VOC family protein [Betaproteobacteria bacterium]